MDLSPPRPRLGVSTCLTGQSVRYDGGHKRDRWLMDVLGPLVEFVPVCPEVEVGLGVPREAMRLEGDPADPRLMTQKTRIDLTERMRTWCRTRLDELAGERLCGYVFKKDSPSSGMERVKVYPVGGGPAARTGSGIFAALFMERFPHLPVEDEGRLNDAGLRENFLERVFVMHRWRELERAGISLGGLVEFHARHKLLVMAHNVEGYRRLGRLVAHGKSRDMDGLAAEYLADLMGSLKRKATLKQHRNVLEHCLGYFKNQLSGDEKAELKEVIEAHANGLIPLIVPVTLINHYVRKYQQPYLASQVYLNPHPMELKLRNHA